MKNKLHYLILLLIIVAACSCKKNTISSSFTIPFSKCKLVYYEFNNSAASNIDTSSTTYSGDSIISVKQSYGSTYYAIYVIDKANKKIIENEYDNTLSNLTYTSQYYLSNEGLIDSNIRTRISTGLVDYKNYITRNAAGKVIHEVIDYITYGYDETYVYDASGNISYEINKSLYVGGTYNDSIVFTYKPQVYNGEPFYITDDIDGSTSKNLPASRTIYNRATMAIKKANTYVYVFDTNLNVTQRALVNTVPTSYTIVENFQHNCN